MAKKKTPKKKPSAQNAAKRSAVKKKLAAKKTPTRKKAVVKKKSVAKKGVEKRSAVKPRTAHKKTTKKKSAAGKKLVVKKKAPAKKPANKKVVVVGAKAGDKKKAATKPAKRRGRVTKMTASEAMISLVTLADSWENFGWLEALYLYGNNLASAAGHRELRFMVIFSGLRQVTQQRAAEKELDKLIKPVIPVRRRLDFLNDPKIIRWVEQENPGFVAAFGQAIPIYVRNPS